MVKQGVEIIKDVFTSILILACIVIVLSIIFYEDLAFSKVVPESSDYALTSKMKEDLNEAELDETKEVVVKYSIDASDLKKYENTKEYNKGKSNPFATISEEIPEDDTTVSNNASSNNNASQNFYQGDGTK